MHVLLILIIASRCESHPMTKRIQLIQSSNVADETFALVRFRVKPSDRVLVLLDSNHTHEHVLNELVLYSALVSVDSYCVVFDAIIEDMHNTSLFDRPWVVVNNPKTAVTKFLKNQSEHKNAGVGAWF